MEITEYGIQKKSVLNFAKIQKSEYSAFRRALEKSKEKTKKTVRESEKGIY